MMSRHKLLATCFKLCIPLKQLVSGSIWEEAILSFKVIKRVFVSAQSTSQKVHVILLRFLSFNKRSARRFKWQRYFLLVILGMCITIALGRIWNVLRHRGCFIRNLIWHRVWICSANTYLDVLLFGEQLLEVLVLSFECLVLGVFRGKLLLQIAHD